MVARMTPSGKQEGPDVPEEPEQVRSVLKIGLGLFAHVLDLVLHVVAVVLGDGPRND